MPVTRKLLAQDTNEENQWLKVDSNKRYLVNDTNDWQFLFGPNSSFTTSTQLLKIAAEFDYQDLDGVRFIAYLYNPTSGTVSNTATVEFNVYLVSAPEWTETLIASFTGTQIFNSYFYYDATTTELLPFDLYGGDTMMVEVVATRLTETYRDRIYINHLGIYKNVFQLRQDVDFLSITKQDL